MAILCKLTGTTWGASEKILKTVYHGTVRPHLEYGSTTWSTITITNQQVLVKVQNLALHIITGAMHSTPITEMEKLTAIQPHSHQKETKNMIKAEEFKCLPDHAMNEKLNRLTKN